MQASVITNKIINDIQETLDCIKGYNECENGHYGIEPPFDILHKSIPSPDFKGCFRFVTIKANTGKELTEEEEEEYRNYLIKTIEKEQECWNAIWDKIKAKGQSWWD